MTQVILAALHLLALGLGLGAVVNRGTALREAPDMRSIQRVFRADMLWAIAAMLWIGTGLWRYLGGLEKGYAYYNANHYFIAKMSLLVLILVLEVWPMITLIRWRIAIGRNESPAAVVAPAAAHRIAIISHIQALLVVLMVFAAAAMARGYGFVTPQ
jgi:putative membrane protein